MCRSWRDLYTHYTVGNKCVAQNGTVESTMYDYFMGGAGGGGVSVGADIRVVQCKFRGLV